ncbi:glycosyltransferase [Zobellia alginiliquefaciens]|uniref:glycosyltransferase n=1 Tax=Zobellia alginiliquefaciens TaxID=3032586 RepID=UPI0023E35506|nr:glycosyltransferase [Zobellia alginiliquefaciens]
MKVNPKNIIFFCPTKNWGGIEKNVLLRTIFLSQNGYNITVVLLKNTFEDRFANMENVTIRTITKRGGDLNLFVVRNYIKIIQKVKPLTVFAALKRDWWLVSLAAHIKKVPNIILYLGNIRKIRTGLKYSLVFKTFKAKVLVNSDSLKTDLLQNSSYFNQDNLIRIYNGIELPKLQTVANWGAIEKLNLPENRFIIGVAGWLNYRKGFDLLPKILEKLPKNTHIIHAGTGGFELDMDQILSNYPELSERIHFLGHVSNMGQFFQNIDVFLLCSREEGMANVLLESLSYGKPIVSSKVPGSEELLDNGTYGILTEIDDVIAMSNGIQAILERKIIFEPELLKQRITDTFSFNHMMANTQSLLFPSKN